MTFHVHTMYFLVGLIICGISTGILTQSAPYGFLVIGGGLIVYSIFMQIALPIIKRITR